MVARGGFGERAFDAAVRVILTALCATVVVPFLQVVTISLSPAAEVSRYGLHLFPTRISLDGYVMVFRDSLIWRSYANTLTRTVLGTCLSLALTVFGAYPLARRTLPHRSFWTAFVLFTMYFSGGLIPLYILIVNVLKLRDTVWALVLPGAISTYSMIIARNFFMGLPAELEESATMDGANDLVILLRVIVPVSMPILATISLWYGVAHWSAWFDCMIYIKTEAKFVLQLVLRRILLEGKVESMTEDPNRPFVSPDSMKMAALLVSVVPIVAVYPFLQKYFVKGVLVGSLKG